LSPVRGLDWCATLDSYERNIRDRNIDSDTRICGFRGSEQGAQMNWKQKTQMKTTKRDSKRESNSTIELAFLRLLLAVLRTAVLIAATVCTAQAEPRKSTERNRNYILRRQEAGLVSGVPTSRLIIGKREIDIYRNGLMFEKDNVVGVRAGSR
jgi:hypothetical protein